MLGHRSKQDFEKGIVGFIDSFDMNFSDYFAKEKITILFVLCQIIIKELENILNTNTDIYQGKIITSLIVIR